MASGSSFSLDRKLFALVAILGASIIATAWVSGLASFVEFFPPAWKPDIASTMGSSNTASSLLAFALEKVLEEASPIYGEYANVQSSTSTWMSQYPDDTRLVHMNIPGTHDAATWNYSIATQQRLKHVTDLVTDTMQPPEWFRCQERSLLDMLDAGVRAFDLRYAQDVTKSTLVFWHGPALQSQTATVDAVLVAFYKWLDDHPSEVVFLSFQYEGSSKVGNRDSADVQLQLHKALTSSAAKRYILQTQDKFGLLGEARGKIIPLRRFDLNLLSQSYEANLPGVHFSPQEWTVNGASIKLVYNPHPSGEDEGIAYIEDYYRPMTPYTSSLAEDIDVKWNATSSHLLRAAGLSEDAHPDSLFWTFTSGTNIRDKSDGLNVTPRMMALGDGEGAEGVNKRLLKFFEDMHNKRLGIVMFDFYDEPEELLDLFLSLKRP